MRGINIHLLNLKIMIMKTLKYFILGMMIACIPAFCNSQVSLKNTQVVILQSVPDHTSAKLLADSKAVLLHRLTAMELHDVQILQNDQSSKLIVKVGDTISRQMLSDLLLTPGHLGFYCVSTPDKTLSEKDVLEAHKDLSTPEHPALNITFKEDAWKLWESSCKGNQDKSVAFTIDGKVYAVPSMAGEIPHGKISLTGSGFSKREVSKLVAIISGGTLPVNFKVIVNK